ncbi:MAG TPA: PIN domain-containing protein [Gemmatimonadaceae bacterium]|nr:PIN domain-containing protein [Gemmatimonadaceae bacterium]
MTRVLLDTGPLVALLNRRDQYHQWARSILDTVTPPVFTCESVLSEACFLLARVDGGPEAVLALVGADVIRVEFQIGVEIAAVRQLVRRYASVPMSFADACLVRMTELQLRSVVLTIDSDFKRYRRNRRHLVPVIMPR